MLREFMLIFTINYVGMLLSKILHLPLPGTIVSLLLLFFMLQFKILKLEKIENAGNFLLLNMTIFFMPPTVKIIDSYYSNYNSFNIFNYGYNRKSCAIDDRF